MKGISYTVLMLRYIQKEKEIIRVNNAQVEWYDQAVVFRKDPNYEVMHDQYQLFSC